LGAEGNAPLGHTLTDSSTTALILIITGREGTLRNLIYTHTRACNDSGFFRNSTWLWSWTLAQL